LSRAISKERIRTAKKAKGRCLGFSWGRLATLRKRMRSRGGNVTGKILLTKGGEGEKEGKGGLLTCLACDWGRICCDVPNSRLSRSTPGREGGRGDESSCEGTAFGLRRQERGILLPPPESALASPSRSLPGKGKKRTRFLWAAGVYTSHHVAEELYASFCFFCPALLF